MKALIIIGLQIDLFPLGSAEIEGAEAILPVVNKAISHYDQLIAARFSHPTEHKMFVANYPWRRPGQEIDVMGEKILLQHYYCIQGSFGAELTMGFDHDAIDFTAWMGTDQKLLPHSAFFDESRKLDTGLDEYLKNNKVGEIHLAGLPFEETIFQTAMDGLELGYRVSILKDGVQAKSTEKANNASQILKRKGVEFL